MAGARRIASWSLGLSLVLLVSVIVSASIGPVDIHPVDVAKSILNAVVLPAGVTSGADDGSLLSGVVPVAIEWVTPFAYDVPTAHQTIVVDLRLPR
ncbi:MAG: iron ABC transporter, partial [Halobacteriota archaeon]